MVPCSSEAFKLQNGKGCPGERLRPCAPKGLGQGARSPVVVGGSSPPISTSETSQPVLAGAGILSPVAHTLSVAEVLLRCI